MTSVYTHGQKNRYDYTGSATGNNFDGSVTYTIYKCSELILYKEIQNQQNDVAQKSRNLKLQHQWNEVCKCYITRPVWQKKLITGKARLYIYNMQGAQVSNVQIGSYGEGNITIQGGSLQPGMYMYTLIADDRVVDTKQMILTKWNLLPCIKS